jgi:hypothetical protein
MLGRRCARRFFKRGEAMATGIDIFMEQLRSKSDDERYNAFQEMLKITDEKVTWFNQYKDELIKKLKDNNSYQRSIGIMLLCNLAKNDTAEKEYKNILNNLLPFIDDEKFITQRQYIQNIWKVAVVDKEYSKVIVKQLKDEFGRCTSKKHYNLLRIDIITSLVSIMNKGNDTGIKNVIEMLIESENDPKNKKKYQSINQQPRSSAPGLLIASSFTIITTHKK